MSSKQFIIKIDKAKLVEVLKPEILKDVKTITSISLNSFTLKHTLKPTVGVNNTYGTPDEYIPPSSLTELFGYIDVTNIDVANNEEIAVKIEVDYGEGIAPSLEFYFGGATEAYRDLYPTDMCDFLPPLDDNPRGIQAIRAYAKSNLSSSNATVKVILGIRYLTVTIS